MIAAIIAIACGFALWYLFHELDTQSDPPVPHEGTAVGEKEQNEAPDASLTENLVSIEAYVLAVSENHGTVVLGAGFEDGLYVGAVLSSGNDSSPGESYEVTAVQAAQSAARIQGGTRTSLTKGAVVRGRIDPTRAPDKPDPHHRSRRAR
ncbi:MAG: hypothetical protein GY946_30565 [bacterium]|nr:hypothetical protein [bacterium]